MCRPHRISRGQVVAVLDPAGVGGRAAVAQEQGAGVAVVDGLLLGGGLVDGTVGVQPDVAVGVDQPGHDPALGRGLGAGDGLERDGTVDDVQVAGLAVGQDRAAEPQGRHVADATGWWRDAPAGSSGVVEESLGQPRYSPRL